MQYLLPYFCQFLQGDGKAPKIAKPPYDTRPSGAESDKDWPRPPRWPAEEWPPDNGQDVPTQSAIYFWTTRQVSNVWEYNRTLL